MKLDMLRNGGRLELRSLWAYWGLQQPEKSPLYTESWDIRTTDLDNFKMDAHAHPFDTINESMLQKTMYCNHLTMQCDILLISQNAQSMY